MRLNRMVVWGAGGAAAAVVLVVVVLVLVMGGDDGDIRDDGATPIAVVLTSVTADAVVLPIQSANLSMTRAGIVHEIRVTENQIVSEGDVLATLVNDRESSAFSKAQTDLAVAISNLSGENARIGKERRDELEALPVDSGIAGLALMDAEANFLFVSGVPLGQGDALLPEWSRFKSVRDESLANAQAGLEQAKEDYLIALGVSSTTGIPETPESRANLANRTQDIDHKKFAVFRLEIEVWEAEKQGEVLQDAINDVTAASNGLDNARWDLDAARAQSALGIRTARKLADGAEDSLRDGYLKWLGVDLTTEEITMDPESLYEQWDLDLDEAFDRSNLAYGNGIAPNDPSTRWNEFTVFAWLYLHPLAGSIVPTCGNTLDVQTGQTCIARDIENVYDNYLDAQDALNTATSEGPSTVADAENAIFAADQALTDAQNELTQIGAGKAEVILEHARAELAEAVAARDDLLDYPDPIVVAQAEAKMLAAEAHLSGLMDWPNAFEIELARGEFRRAESRYARLSAGPDPLDEARRDAALAKARAAVDVADSNLEIATIALADTEIRAPFGGTVTAVDINAGEEIGPADVVMRLADISRWEVETDDLDELSVVNLREGDAVIVKFDALPGLEMQGTVSSISKFGEQKQGAITFTAKIRLDGFDERLRWNMTATISKTDTGA